MKKILFLIILILLFVFGYIYFNYKDDYKLILKDIDKEFSIDNYSIFGQFFNINACINEKIDDIDMLKLVLKNKDKEIVLNTNFYIESNKTCFNLKDNGLSLDNLELGKYLMLIKYNEKYYTLKNNTKYSNLEYYTVTKDESNNKIDVIFDKYINKNYLEFNIKEKILPDNVYDITIDAGHGGKDVGASYKYNGITYYESNFTLDIALILKDMLEDNGYKVKITRDDDIYLENYGKNGRAVIPNLVNSKYSLSIHINSSSGIQNYGGVEVYIPNENKLDLAKLISDNISNIVNYSKNPTFKIDNGIYFKYFTKSDIESSKESALENDLKPYDISENTPYMYMIREVGGINTGAYIDGRNEYYGKNPYYNSNQTAEPYLIELAYINYSNDLDMLINNKSEFAKAISDAFYKYFTSFSQK